MRKMQRTEVKCILSNRPILVSQYLIYKDVQRRIHRSRSSNLSEISNAQWYHCQPYQTQSIHIQNKEQEQKRYVRSTTSRGLRKSFKFVTHQEPSQSDCQSIRQAIESPKCGVIRSQYFAGAQQTKQNCRILREKATQYYHDQLRKAQNTQKLPNTCEIKKQWLVNMINDQIAKYTPRTRRIKTDDTAYKRTMESTQSTPNNSNNLAQIHIKPESDCKMAEDQCKLQKKKHSKYISKKRQMLLSQHRIGSGNTYTTLKPLT